MSVDGDCLMLFSQAFWLVSLGSDINCKRVRGLGFVDALLLFNGAAAVQQRCCCSTNNIDASTRHINKQYRHINSTHQLDTSTNNIDTSTNKNIMPVTQKFLSVTIVRHAETEIDLKRPRIMSGQINMPLTPAGKIQAQALAERLARLSYSDIYTSDSQQAAETLEEIIKLQEHYKVFVDQRLRECNLGKISGMSHSDILEFLNEGSMSLDDYIDNNAESKEKFQERIQDFYSQIIRDSVIDQIQQSPKSNVQIADPSGSVNLRNILVISHGGWIDSLMRYLINDLNFKLETTQNDRFAYKSSIYQFHIQKIISDDCSDYEWQGVIQMMNDASHLAALSKFNSSNSNGKMPRDSPVEKPFTSRKEIMGMLGIYCPFEPNYQEKSSPLASFTAEHDVIYETPTAAQRKRTLGW